MSSEKVKGICLGERTVALDTGVFQPGENSFAIYVEGDGMRNAGINNGDLLICDADRTPENGDIAILILKGKPFCRRVFFEGDMIRIRREDGETPDILAKDPGPYKICAVVIGSMRVYKQGDGAKHEENGISVSE